MFTFLCVQHFTRLGSFKFVWRCVCVCDCMPHVTKFARTKLKSKIIAILVRVSCAIWGTRKGRPRTVFSLILLISSWVVMVHSLWPPQKLVKHYYELLTLLQTFWSPLGSTKVHSNVTKKGDWAARGGSYTSTLLSG